MMSLFGTSIVVIAVVVVGFAFLLSRKSDDTTAEEVYQIGLRLEKEIYISEQIVGKHAPNSYHCRQLLEKARYCLWFSGRNQRLVVSNSMIKHQRLQGIKYAREAAEYAVSYKKD